MHSPMSVSSEAASILEIASGGDWHELRCCHTFGVVASFVGNTNICVAAPFPKENIELPREKRFVPRCSEIWVEATKAQVYRRLSNLNVIPLDTLFLPLVKQPYSNFTFPMLQEIDCEVYNHKICDKSISFFSLSRI